MKLPLHKQYREEIGIYSELADFISGERDRHIKYIIPHETEKSGQASATNALNRRLETLEVFNHSGLVLDLHTGALNQVIQPDDSMEGGQWEEILSDVTGFSQDIGDFTNEIIKERLTNGRVGVLIDAPDSVSESEQQRRVNNERSYSVVFPAGKMLNWNYFVDGSHKGKLNLVTLELEPKDGKRRFLNLEIVKAGENYIWQEYESVQDYKEGSIEPKEGIEVELVTGGNGAFDEIPFVMWGSGIKDSDIRPTQLISKNRLNKKSALDNILFYQGFQRIAGFGISAAEQQKMSESAFMVTSNQNGRFQVIEPGNPGSLESDIKSLDRLAFRVGLKQKHMLADDTREVQSAESKAKDAEALNDYYDKFLDKAQDVLTQIFSWHAQFESLDAEVVLTIARTYRSEDSDRQLAEREVTFLQATQMGAQETRKEVLKQGVMRLALTPKEGQIEAARRQELLDEIDALSLNQVGRTRSFNFDRAINGNGNEDNQGA